MVAVYNLRDYVTKLLSCKQTQEEAAVQGAAMSLLRKAQ